MAGSQFPEASEDDGGRAAGVTCTPGPGDLQHGTGVGVPPDRQLDRRGAPGESDVLHEKAHQLLPLDVGRRGGMPDGGQSRDQCQNAWLRLGAEELRGTLQPSRRITRQPRHLRAWLVPLALEAACHEPVFRLDSQAAATGEVRRILGALQSQVPLAFDLTGLGCQAVQSRQGNSQVGGLDGVEEGLGDGGVEAIPPQGVAGRGSKIDRRSGTGREGSDAIVQGAHPHPPPTLAAQHKALEEGGSLTDGAPLLFRPAGAIVRKARLIVEKLRPGQGAGVDIVEEHGPVLQGDSARPACDPGGATREETGPGGRPPIDRGARRRGGVEHRQDARVAQRLPADLAVRLLAPQAVRKAQVRRRELLDDREGRGLRLTEGKDELDSLLDLLVRIAHALAGGIEDEPTGGRKRRWPCAACCRLPPSRRLRRQ